MKKLAIAALTATTLMAAPAFAQSASSFAIMHFNMDQDSAGDVVMTPAGDAPVVVELAPGSTLSDVFGELNMSFDSASDIDGTNGVTVITNTNSAAAQAIFDMLRESDMDMGN